MRNEPKPLDRATAARAYAYKDTLEKAGDKPVTVHYTKRDGAESSSSGPVKFFNGREGMDTMSVTIDDPNKGPRTINLCRVRAVVL